MILLVYGIWGRSYYIEVYGDGPAKIGRNYRFAHCDIDVVDIDSTMAEAELMLMVVEAGIAIVCNN